MSGIIPINPAGMTLRDWTDRMVGILSKYGVRMRLMRDDEWKTWAIYVNRVMSKTKGQLPDPRGYEDWRQWAQRLNGVLSS